MHFVIQEELDTRREALHILERLCKSSSESGMEADCREYGQKLGYTAEEYDRILAPVLETYTKVEATLPPFEPEQRALFAPLSTEQGSLAMLLERVRALELRRGRAFLEGERLGLLLCLLQPDLVEDQGNCESSVAFVRGVAALEMTEAEKYHCIRAGLDFDAQCAVLDAVLPPVQEQVEAQKEKLQPLLALWREHYRGMEDVQILAELEKMGMLLENQPSFSIALSPSCMCFATLSMSVLDEEKIGARLGEMEVGALVWEVERHRQETQEDVGRLMADFKAMGDATRMEILRALAGGEKYAQELTALLHLTPATVSHHMRELVGRELVSMEQRGTRLYYTLRRDRLERIAQALRSL